jgi:acetyl-CoA synthetase
MKSLLVVNVEHAADIRKATTAMMPGRDVWYHEGVATQPSDCPPVWVPAEHPLFLLYTSGSTGSPKGVQHSTAGYMVFAAATCKYVFNLRPKDVYWCTADCGWITGHTYLTYGPLLNGVASVVFEGVPNYPDCGRLWEVVAKWNVQQFYTAPTVIRALMSHGDEPVQRHDRSSLEVHLILQRPGCLCPCHHCRPLHGW